MALPEHRRFHDSIGLRNVLKLMINAIMALFETSASAPDSAQASLAPLLF